jgi:hypothetical protein
VGKRRLASPGLGPPAPIRALRVKIHTCRLAHSPGSLGIEILLMLKPRQTEVYPVW